MKKTIRLSTFLTVALMTSQVHAYKFVIYTDEAVTNKSEQVAELMKNTYPFSKFNIEVEIVRVPAKDLDCGSSNGIDRLITCENLDNIQAMAAKRGGDQAMIVKNIPKFGGSSGVGGGVPVITTGTSPRGMLHEYLHTLGLCDEYEYKPEETTFYCGRDSKQPNLTFIQPMAAYSGDQHARGVHAMDIPWYGQIFSTTLITNSHETMLGTGSVNYNKTEPVNNTKEPQTLGEPTGLYQGKVCNKATPKKFSWQPGGGSTIMENIDSGLGAPLERVVEKIMESKGAKKRMTFNEPDEVEVVAPTREGERPAKVTKVDPKPDYEINDSGRNLFKTFFQWIQNLFNYISNGFSR